MYRWQLWMSLFATAFNSGIHWTAGLFDIHPVNPGSVVIRGAATALFLCMESDGKLYSTVRNVHKKMALIWTFVCKMIRFKVIYSDECYMEYDYAPLHGEWKTLLIRKKLKHYNVILMPVFFFHIFKDLNWYIKISNRCNIYIFLRQTNGVVGTSSENKLIWVKIKF